jgi:hypothetical protein
LYQYPFRQQLIDKSDNAIPLKNIPTPQYRTCFRELEDSVVLSWR